MAKRSTYPKVPLKYFISKEEFQEFIEEEKEWMYNRIHQAIEESFAKGYEEAHILDAKIEDSMTIISMNSARYEWANSLELAIQWYSGVEMYERCAEILKLIKKIRTADNRLL